MFLFKQKISRREFVDLLVSLTLDMWTEEYIKSNWPSVIDASKYKKTARIDKNWKIEWFLPAAFSLARVGFEILILNMFIITFLCRKKEIPRDILDEYHKGIYIFILNIIPEKIEIQPKVYIGSDALIKAFEEEWLNNRYTMYYRAMSNAKSSSEASEIGRIIVENLGGDKNDFRQILEANVNFTVSLKNIGKLLDKLRLKS